jgi:hypothetical protein
MNLNHLRVNYHFVTSYLNVSPVSEYSFLIEKACRFGYKFVKLISDALIPPRRSGSSFSESNLGLN